MNKIILFIICTILIILSYSFLYLYFIKIYQNEKLISIPKGTSIKKVVNIILPEENNLNKNIYYSYLKVFNKYIDTIKFGEFKIKKNLSLIQISNIISKTSNIYIEFRILGGWQTYQLEKLIKDKINDSFLFSYTNTIADTYMYQSHNSLKEIYALVKKTKDNFFNKYQENELLNKYSIDEIMIIASLVEKEGKTDQDKKIISSVILNRLEKNLKLQVDATTIFSITKGKYKLNRKLSYKDLKIKDNYNTYYIKGLPPFPICYVSRKTIEIVMENYKSNYLFYFFNEKDQAHVFSTTYKEHILLLNKYRKNE